MKRWLGAALVALVMTACSTTAVSAPTRGPTPAPTSGPTPALPADQVVFSVSSAGGLVPPVYYALESPALVIYGDGRLLTVTKSAGLQMVPARFDLAHIDPAAVASFVSQVEAGGVVSPATDFGTPGVTDQAATTVMVNGANGPQEASAYAFDERFEPRLTAAQRSARASLRTVIDQAANLAAGAGRTAYTPDRVVVYEVDPAYVNGAATKGWPGPPPSSFLKPSDTGRSIACGELAADPAEQVYRAALDNPGALWLVDGVTRVLAVNPLPLAGCP